MPSTQKLVPGTPVGPLSDPAVPTVMVAPSAVEATETSAAPAPAAEKNRKRPERQPKSDRSAPGRGDAVRLRRQFAVPFWVIFVIGTLAIIGFAVTPLAFSDPKYVNFIRLEQISLTALIGYVVTFLGVLVSWMGLETSYRVEGRGKGYSLVIAATSPGVLLIVGGCVIVGVCVLKPYTHSTTGPADATPPPVDVHGQTDVFVFGRSTSAAKEFVGRYAAQLETENDAQLVAVAKALVAEADHSRNVMAAVGADFKNAKIELPPSFKQVLSLYEAASKPPESNSRTAIHDWFQNLKNIAESKK